MASFRRYCRNRALRESVRCTPKITTFFPTCSPSTAVTWPQLSQPKITNYFAREENLPPPITLPLHSDTPCLDHEFDYSNVSNTLR